MSSRKPHVHQIVSSHPSLSPRPWQWTICSPSVGLPILYFSSKWSHATCGFCVWLLPLKCRFWFRRFGGRARGSAFLTAPSWCRSGWCKDGACMGRAPRWRGCRPVRSREARALTGWRQQDNQWTDHWWNRTILKICKISFPQSW